MSYGNPQQFEENTVTCHRMYIIWAYLRKPMALPGKIDLSVLTIPDSNAAQECVF